MREGCSIIILGYMTVQVHVDKELRIKKLTYQQYYTWELFKDTLFKQQENVFWFSAEIES